MAKRFQFRLETLLRVRALREREAKRRFGAKRAEIARLDQLDRQTAEGISRRQDQLRRHQQQGTLAPHELVRERAWIDHLRRTIVERRVLRARLSEELKTLQERWSQARTNKRIIEKLRERRREEFVRRRKRAEQAESDELAQRLHVFDRAASPATAGQS